MKKIKICIALASLSILFSCNSDDDTTQQLTTEELTEILVNNFTGNSQSEGTWKISSALLTNSGVTDLNVSNAFNIKDDEFVFRRIENSNNISLEHKQKNVFNDQAVTFDGVLLDYYKSSETYMLSISDLEAQEFSEVNHRFVFNTDSSIDGTLTTSNGTLKIVLTQKTASDYPQPPTSGLNFTEAFTFESDGINGFAPGMIGSNSNNSFYLVTRETLDNGNAEHVIKYDLDTQTISENFYMQTSFVSKQLHIQNNQLIVLGATYVNTYDLDLSEDPSSIEHGRLYSRHGVAVQNSEMFAIGGCLDGNENSDCTKIHKWNIENQTMTEVATLPEPRSGARATIVENKLYIFGGTEEFIGDFAENTIYVYDINNDSFETLTMPTAVNLTFVDRYQNLIYVGGSIVTDGNEDIFLGVLDTETNVFTELSSNLDDSDNSGNSSNTIHGMCIFNEKMYVIYGGDGLDNGGQFNEWQVMVADL